MVNIGNSWDGLLAEEFKKPYYQKLRKFLINEYRTRTVYPDMYSIFNALKLCPFEDVKVVILGQDPYHGEGQAHGLSFSVQKGIAPPPSLLNIFKEIKDDVGVDNFSKGGDLTPWARQGVLLLNAVLTVRAGEANSHKNKGWEVLTDKIIDLLARREKPMVFMLWGGNAAAKARFVREPHLLLKAPHPSPLSAYRGFFGCRHFSAANNFLVSRGFEPIDWSVEDNS